MALYNTIGKTYAQTRKSDPRIAAKLLEILGCSPASSIADIGAATGSYSVVLAEHGYHVFGVEQSATMRSQAIAHPAIEWIDRMLKICLYTIEQQMQLLSCLLFTIFNKIIGKRCAKFIGLQVADRLLYSLTSPR